MAIINLPFCFMIILTFIMCKQWRTRQISSKIVLGVKRCCNIILRKTLTLIKISIYIHISYHSIFELVHLLATAFASSDGGSLVGVCRTQATLIQVHKCVENDFKCYSLSTNCKVCHWNLWTCTTF